MIVKEEFERYHRQMLLPDVGLVGQTLLKNAKVLVVGAGGLGCPVLLYLAASGVGTIGVVDFDTVAVSNLHRQILFNTDDLNKNKAIVAAEKLRLSNAHIDVVAFNQKLTKENAALIIDNFDIIVDACDDFETRYIINDSCELVNKPVVYGAIQKHEGQLSVFNYNNSVSYSKVFPKGTSNLTIRNCNENGVLGVVPGIIGIMQANEVLKIILKKPFENSLANKLLLYNFDTQEQTIILL